MNGLESLTPSNCKTNTFTKNESAVCTFQIWIQSRSTRSQPSSTVPIWENKASLSLGAADTTPSTLKDERIELKISVLEQNDVSIQSNFMYYFCSTDLCNTLDNMKRVINATTMNFDYSRVISQLAANESVTMHNPIPYDSYIQNEGSTFVVPFCMPCHTSTNSSEPITTCIKAEARTCGNYKCGACYWARPIEEHKLAEFEHQKIFWINTRNITFSFWFTCTLPYCNTETKQDEIKSLYELNFDMNKFAGEVVISTTELPYSTANNSLYSNIGVIVTLLFCLLFGCV
ncbi:unnamed protein product [Adineta ricciae]|uniref:Uncharacterized protein n=1 Tax=Adineta ricciae TaxID=249248 RepID=A0A814FML9_ADIRI|nr:unnamed protein product [Adineta ricciae]